MLRSRVRSFHAEARSPVVRSSTAAAAATIGCGSELLGSSTWTHSPICHTGGPLLEQRRYSFKYATKRQHNEVRQPSYIHDKRFGVFSNEHNIGKARRGLPFITPLYTKHQSLWETDTDASTNRLFRSFVFGQREAHQLLGRPHGFEAKEVDGRNGDAAYEQATDQRWKGVPRPAMVNLHYEPEWHRTVYRSTAHGSQLSNPSSALTAAVLGPELVAVRDVKSVEHCQAWFDRLSFLIQQHYDAVGDTGEFRSRHTRHVHEFFVAFHDAVSSFDFQDRYLLDAFAKTRPAHLQDLFAVFLEMEANYVNEAFCPRCSLPYATTRFCGEGDANTPFRQHRGQWAPHQHWGQEWYSVVMRRAEALWYRATEDPFFGTTMHTQRQVEGLLKVYVKTKYRAKVVDFFTAIRGSQEYLLGHIRITDEMQKTADALLDGTPHQHLLTNAFSLDSRAAKYTGDAHSVPHSPLQMRLDMEMNKYRRQQREDGVVRLPPADWRVDTSAIVPYQIDPKTRHVTNWRAVKEGLEKSFLSTGLPKEAYTGQEWREMLHLKERIASRGARRALYEAERQEEEAAMTKQYGPRTADRPATAATGSWLVFPDKVWYRVFETTPAALRPYGLTQAGQRILVRTRVYPNPAAVPHTDPARNAALLLDTTPEACEMFGGFESGQVIRLTTSGDDGTAAATVEVIVVGVDKSGAEGEWCLYAMYRDASLHETKGLLSLGTDSLEILSRYPKIELIQQRATPMILDAQRTLAEEELGQVVGVRKGELYVQWYLQRGGSSELDCSVAIPLGNPETVKHLYQLQILPDSATSTTTSTTAAAEETALALREPPSWRTPFRNDFVDERLKEVEQAPFHRERWASLIPGKYTPKVKRFGYTQHTTQDDFETKEYKDRVLARQFFHNPEAFAIVPERRERSVKFRGKWEHQRVCGLPTVDRDELERGWGEAEDMTDAEVGVIEQALRDISGRRPGNFVKSPSETSSLRLNESWWTPLEFGWEEHNREQTAFLDSSERRIIESAKLPFGGKRPPFGTTYGMGERISEIAADYAKGFGLGPHGRSPKHDTGHFNTLQAEEQRTKTLGLGNPLVRLFNEKLGNQTIEGWASQQCADADADVRQLLLSVEEWRMKGRAPSLLLRKVLQRYLKDELEVFNSGLPAHVPRLAVSDICDSLDSSGSRATVSDGTIWADVDRTAYALAYADQYQRGDSDEAYIVGLVQRAALAGTGGSDSAAGHGVGNAHTAFMQQDILRRFQADVARIVGRGIPSAFIADRTARHNRGLDRASGYVLTLVRVQELANLLAKMRVSGDSISIVVRGLSQCPEREQLSGDDFAVPVSLIFSWSGPQSPLTSGGGGGSARGPSNMVQQMLERTRQGSSGSGARHSQVEKMVGQVLEELSWSQDGLAADLLYTVEQNRRNPTLRQEFMNAFCPVYGNDETKVQQIYEAYTAGKFVPNITTAIEAFIFFLKNMSTNPEAVKSVVEYFEVEAAAPAEAVGAVRPCTQLRLLPLHLGPFQYESTLIESLETMERFRRYGILAGPTRAPVTGFIAANSSSLTYVANREKEVVYVTTDNDQGLRNALRRSALYKDIARHPDLQLLLPDSPAGSQPSSGGGVHAHARLVSTFNRFFYRVAPMLSFYQNVLKDYSATQPAARLEAQTANAGLARALEAEASSTIEQDFRRNSERYWRNVLEGRSGEEAGFFGGGRSTAAGVNNGTARRSLPQRPGGRHSGTSSGEFNLASVVGDRAAAGVSGGTTTAAARGRESGQKVGPSSPTPSETSTSNRVKNLLGTLKGSGGGAGGAPARGGAASPSPSSARSSQGSAGNRRGSGGGRGGGRGRGRGGGESGGTPARR